VCFIACYVAFSYLILCCVTGSVELSDVMICVTVFIFCRCVYFYFDLFDGVLLYAPDQGSRQVTDRSS